MDDDAHRARVEAHRARRDARYRAADGWLTLVDRVELEPGDNPLAPGVFVVVDDTVALRIAAGEQVMIDGVPATGEHRLVVDEPGARASVIEHAGRRYDVARRGDRLRVRVRDPEAPARHAFRGIPAYPFDPAARVTAHLEPIDPPRRDVVAMTDGSEGDAPCIGVARFELGGSHGQLGIYLEESSGKLFTSFTDATSRAETYGGGRMLYVERPAPGQPWVLDFNLAFNPPCAFNPLVTCPLPPAGNRLAVAVRAGERRPDAGDLLP